MTAPLCLLTRPKAQSYEFAAELSGIDCLISPVIRIEPVSFDRDLADQAADLVFTSANAVTFAGPGQGRRALCVGPGTAGAAHKAGFDVTTGPGDAGGLIPLLEGRGDWLHLHGRYRARALPVPGLVVYDQVVQELNSAAWDVLAGSRGVILPLFSPRSATLLSNALTQAGMVSAPIAAVAISARADKAYSGPAVLRMIAAQPDRAGMVQAIKAAYSSERSGFPWVEAVRGGR
ncbi:MAG: uroporphyrinogen-III synthase [Paracoccus sp. (in: a-proteobacteria)]